MEPTNNQFGLRNILTEINKALISTKEKITSALSKSYATFSARLGGISLSDPEIKQQAKHSLQANRQGVKSETRQIKPLTQGNRPLAEKIRAFFSKKPDPLVEDAIKKFFGAIDSAPISKQLKNKFINKFKNELKEVKNNYPSLVGALIKKKAIELDELLIKEIITDLKLDRYKGETFESRKSTDKVEGKYAYSGFETVNSILHDEKAISERVNSSPTILYSKYNAQGEPSKEAKTLEIQHQFLSDLNRGVYSIDGKVASDYQKLPSGTERSLAHYDTSAKFLNEVCEGKQLVFNNLTRFLSQGSMADLTTHLLLNVAGSGQDSPVQFKASTFNFNVEKRFDFELSTDVIHITITARHEAHFQNTQSANPMAGVETRYIDVTREITIPADQLNMKWEDHPDIIPALVVKDTFSEMKPRNLQPLEKFKGLEVHSNSKQPPYPVKQDMQDLLAGKNSQTLASQTISAPLGVDKKPIGKNLTIPRAFLADFYRCDIYVDNKVLSSRKEFTNENKEIKLYEITTALLEYCNNDEQALYNVCCLINQASQGRTLEHLLKVGDYETLLRSVDTEKYTVNKRYDEKLKNEVFEIIIPRRFQLTDTQPDARNQTYFDKYINVKSTIEIPFDELKIDYKDKKDKKSLDKIIAPHARVSDTYSALENAPRKVESSKEQVVRKIRHKHYKLPSKNSKITIPIEELKENHLEAKNLKDVASSNIVEDTYSAVKERPAEGTKEAQKVQRAESEQVVPATTRRFRTHKKIEKKL